MRQKQLNETKTVYDQLFQRVQLPDEEKLIFSYEGPEVYDNMPTEEEITMALYQMRNRKASGMTGITAENLKRWEKGAKPGEGVNPIPIYEKRGRK